MRGAKDTWLLELLDEVPAEQFTIVYPAEPERYQRDLMKAAGVHVLVSARVGSFPRVFSRGELERWLRRVLGK